MCRRPQLAAGKYGYWLFPLTTGLVAGSALMAVLMVAIGRVTGAGDWSATTRTSVLAVMLVVFLGFDVDAVARGTVSRLGFRRQTPQRFKYSRRRSVLAFCGAPTSARDSPRSG